MENISENTEATVINTVAEDAVEKTDIVAAVITEENDAAPITESELASTEETATTTALLPPCDSSEDSKVEWYQWGWFIVVAILVSIVLCRLIVKTKKRSAGKGKKKSFKSNPNAVEIYVGNLSYEMGNSDLRKEFEKFGIVTSARIITQRNSRKSKGYGFVEMPHRSEAEEAIRALNNKEIKGRKIHVNEARANTRHGNH